ERSDGNIFAALGPAATQIAKQITELQLKPRFRAAPGDEGASVDVPLLEPRSRATQGNEVASADAPLLEPRSQAAQGKEGASPDEPLLEHELALLRVSLRAQGWRLKETPTAFRVTSPNGKRVTIPLLSDAKATRHELRAPANRLREEGLRVPSEMRRLLS